LPTEQWFADRRRSAIEKAVPADTWGTTHGGPVDTTIPIAVAGGKCFPAAALKLMIYPGRTVRLATCLTAPRAQPEAPIACSAAFCFVTELE
jgi:hypothetical protein